MRSRASSVEHLDGDDDTLDAWFRRAPPHAEAASTARTFAWSESGSPAMVGDFVMGSAAASDEARRSPRHTGSNAGYGSSWSWYQRVFTHRSNLRPTSRKVPTSSNPSDSCNAMEAGLGSAMTATTACIPSERNSLSRCE